MDEEIAERKRIRNRSTNTDAAEFMKHIHAIMENAEDIEIHVIDGTSIIELLECHRKRPNVSQNTWLNQRQTLRHDKPQRLGIGIKSIEGMDFDLFAADKTDRGPRKCRNGLRSIGLLINIKIDEDIGGTRSPKAEQKKVFH